jgi:hypothetical protein
MRLWTCDKDGFNAEPVAGTEGICFSDAFSVIPHLYDPSQVLISISFNNPDGAASIVVEVDDPENDNIQKDYYFIN